MNPYAAPLEEMHFLINHLTDIQKVAEVTGTDSLADQELVHVILDQAARFAQEVLAPLDAAGDKQGAQWLDGKVTTPPGFKEAYTQYVESGWNNISISGEHGGQGLPNLICAALVEMFVSANKAFCYCPELTKSAVKTLINAASTELRETYLPKLVSGDWTATMNLTEPQAGSDVGALKTRAIAQHDDSYRIFGQKIFITCGEHDLSENIVHLVLARITGAPKGSKGVSLFVVPKYLPDSGERNDVQCAGIEHKLGNHASATCTLIYGERGQGAKGWLVGKENKGLQAMFVMVNASRFNVGMESLSMSEKAYQQALNYARERVQGKLVGGNGEPVPIIKHPDVRRMLLLMRCQTEALRAFAYALAEARDFAEHHPDTTQRSQNQALVSLLIPIFKGWASETGVDVTSTSIQVHGGMGYIEESGVSQAFRDHRITTIYEGTTGIQAHDLIERKLVRDQGQSYQYWRAQMQNVLQALKEQQHPELDPVTQALESGLESLHETTLWVIDNYASQPQQVLSGSVPYLRLCGIVAGGWQMARAALAAHKLRSAGEGNSDFLCRKLASARFYTAHVMPEVQALAVMVKELGEATLALDDAAF